MIGVPTTSLASHVRTMPGMWRCAQCGVTRRYTQQLHRQKTCSHRCQGLMIRGNGNPAYRHGRRSAHRVKTGVSLPPVCDNDVQRIEAWAAARDCTGEAIAAELGISRRCVYKHLRRIRERT